MKKIFEYPDNVKITVEYPDNFKLDVSKPVLNAVAFLEKDKLLVRIPAGAVSIFWHQERI